MGLARKNFKDLDAESYFYKRHIGLFVHIRNTVYKVSSFETGYRLQLVEKVQRKSTKPVRGFIKLSYQQRLEKLGLTTREKKKRQR